MNTPDMSKNQRPLNVRREFRSRTGRFRAGKLAPVMAVAVRGSEGGMLSQTIMMELDPIAGRMVTQMYAEMTSVFVPVQAIDAIKDPLAAYAGMTEVLRAKLLTGAPLFGLEAEGEISKRCKVNPRSIGGVKMVSEAVRLAHNAAVNFLRTQKYDKATKLLFSNTAVTPCLVTQTVLELLNGVLDPDDRINGQVALQMPNLLLPVEGIGILSSNTNVPTVNNFVRDTGDPVSYPLAVPTDAQMRVRVTGATAALARPAVFARLNSAVAPGLNISLDDLYNAETADRLVRQMRAILEENPEYGEDMILRWAHGLNVEDGRMPFLLSEQRVSVGRNIVSATDTAGVQNDTMRTDSMTTVEFTVAVPRTELGGIIITFACLKPDETLSSQPHPYLSDTWGVENFVADEMMLDPVAVTHRSLDSEVLVGGESTVAMYTGYNALKKAYSDYGLSRQLNPTTVANKTAVWQLALPLSVTPQNILYPDPLPQTPFLDVNAEVVTYTITTNARIMTPTQFGPTPVEEMAVINAQTLLTN